MPLGDEAMHEIEQAPKKLARTVVGLNATLPVG
jgi:hypothetical protein